MGNRLLLGSFLDQSLRFNWNLWFVCDISIILDFLDSSATPSWTTYFFFEYLYRSSWFTLRQSYIFRSWNRICNWNWVQIKASLKTLSKGGLPSSEASVEYGDLAILNVNQSFVVLNLNLLRPIHCLTLFIPFRSL